jgi:uncharacterized protein (TIGR02246 family)
MATTTIDQEILDLENQYWSAIRDGDTEAAARLTDDPCIVTGAQGAASISRDQFAGMLDSPNWTVHEYEIHDPVVQQLSDDVAVIAYRVTEKMTVENKPVTLEAADASTWVRRDGNWLCALHTESILGDAFGRDKR